MLHHEKLSRRITTNQGAFTDAQLIRAVRAAEREDGRYRRPGARIRRGRAQHAERARDVERLVNEFRRLENVVDDQRRAALDVQSWTRRYHVDQSDVLVMQSDSVPKLRHPRVVDELGAERCAVDDRRSGAPSCALCRVDRRQHLAVAEQHDVRVVLLQYKRGVEVVRHVGRRCDRDVGLWII